MNITISSPISSNQDPIDNHTGSEREVALGTGASRKTCEINGADTSKKSFPMGRGSDLGTQTN